MVEARKEWNAKVVYGDTDSMFVLLEVCHLDQSVLLIYVVLNRDAVKLRLSALGVKLLLR